MSLLGEYDSRTAWKYEPVRGFFHTADSLTAKVRQDGSYAPFPGSTVVFRPGKRELYMIALMQELLERRLEGTQMLAAPLPPSSVHMTLHDLVSPENCASDPADRAQFRRETAQSLERAAAVVEEIRTVHAGRHIALTADRIVSMVSKSLVLMLRPRTEADYQLLADMYARFDGIVRLPYALTPHITLAYFRPGMLDGDRLGQVPESVQIHPENAPVFEFGPEGLTAQFFRDMQSYTDVPLRVCFCCDGGLNRSVMAANILTQTARMRGLPVTGAARAAFPSTQGRPVPDCVWDTLEGHGIQPDRACLHARFLEEGEAAHFSSFAGITAGAMERFSRLGLPDERIYDASPFFFGVRDPEYGEASYEQTFCELAERAARYLDVLEGRYGLQAGAQP